MEKKESDGRIGTVSFCLYLLCIVSFTPGFIKACRLEQCVNEYSSALEEGRLKGPESTAAYCQQLKSYGTCVKAASRSCRGDLQYHSTWSIISTLTKRFNCSRFRLKPQRQECSYYGRQDYSYCNFYGQPHLITFSALYCNCNFKTSTTLIDNQFFSVAVTRGHLISEGSFSQMNVTIKSGGTPCASEKQYVANADQQLPYLFTDDSKVGGLKNSILINSSRQGTTETVQIYMRYIDTTIVIKKTDTFFAFSCRMPSDILNFDPGGLEVCRSGCPDNDILDTETARSEQLVWRSAMEKCSEYTKFDSRSTNRTGWRLRDWCLYDVISSYAQERTTQTITTYRGSMLEPVTTFPENISRSNYNDSNAITTSRASNSNVLPLSMSILSSCLIILCLIFSKEI